MIARPGVVRAKPSSRLGPERLIRPPGEMGLGQRLPSVSPFRRRKDDAVKRPFIGTAAFAVLVVVAAGAPAVSAQTQQPAALSAGALHLLSGDDPLCSSGSSLCADPYDNPYGQYVGHDEPSLIYKSGIPGSGNDMTYTVTLPKDPKQQPNASGTGGGTWDSSGGPFWFGLTMCDSQSSPEFTNKCTPNRDSNARSAPIRARPTTSAGRRGRRTWSCSSTPRATPRSSPGRMRRDPYCAAMTIDSLTRSEHRRPQQHRLPTTTSWSVRSRSTGRTSPRVASRRRRPTRWRGLDAEPRSSRPVRKDLMMNPGDRPGRVDARYAGGVPDRHHSISPPASTAR